MVSKRQAWPVVYTVPKAEGLPNEDRYQSSYRKGLHALSDGASVSFDPASWAQILVRRYAQNPEVTREWVKEAIAEFGRLYDRDSLPWMKQASFDRGTFASLLGVRMLDEGRRIQILSIGDTLAVLCDGDAISSTFPYTEPTQFDQRPQLLCTNTAENRFMDTTDFDYDRTADWTFCNLQRPALLCMTDALGHWLLSQRSRDPSPIAVLRGIRTPRAFQKFVLQEREAGRLRRDDTTLMAFW
jgi:hypothetical protein